MPTIVETLTQLGQDLRDAIAACLGLRSDMQSIKDSTVSSTTTIINQFLGRPPVVQVFCDPVNGDDANSGSTSGLARRSIDTILDELGTTATTIILLGDATIRRRRNIYPSLSIYGAQIANNGAGYTFTQRTLTLLGTAENSPRDDGTTFSAGGWLFSPNLFTSYINFFMEDQAGTQTHPSHFTSDFGLNVVLQTGTILGRSNNVRSLLGSHANPMVVYLTGIVFGSFGSGHVFEGVVSGGNPNNSYNYKTNITSA